MFFLQLSPTNFTISRSCLQQFLLCLSNSAFLFSLLAHLLVGITTLDFPMDSWIFIFFFGIKSNTIFFCCCLNYSSFLWPLGVPSHELSYFLTFPLPLATFFFFWGLLPFKHHKIFQAYLVFSPPSCFYGRRLAFFFNKWNQVK